MSGREDIVINFKACRAAINKSLGLLGKSYKPSPDGQGGGWYHRLDVGAPGPTATAIALMAFELAGRNCPHLEAGLLFLKRRQTHGRKGTRARGGWATNTNRNLATMEATGWVARYLALLRQQNFTDAPDIGAALDWVTANQNEDGGWGSCFGCPSRTYLTCMALRVLALLEPEGPALKRGVVWMEQARDAGSYIWGETPARTPTLLHTSFALITADDLRDGSRIGQTDHACRWLVENLDPTKLADANSQVENYNIVIDPTSQVQVHVSLPHYGLPFAISALLRHGGPEMLPQVARGVATLVSAQLVAGHWPSVQSAAEVSIWSIWPFFHTLLDITSGHIPRMCDGLVLGTGNSAFTRAVVEVASVFAAGARNLPTLTGPSTSNQSPPVAKPPGLVDRKALVRTVSRFSPSDMAVFVTLIEGAADHIGRHGAVREQAADLIRWAESSAGPGLDAIQSALEDFR